MLYVFNNHKSAAISNEEQGRRGKELTARANFRIRMHTIINEPAHVVQPVCLLISIFAVSISKDVIEMALKPMRISPISFRKGREILMALRDRVTVSRTHALVKTIREDFMEMGVLSCFIAVRFHEAKDV